MNKQMELEITDANCVLRIHTNCYSTYNKHLINIFGEDNFELIILTDEQLIKLRDFLIEVTEELSNE